MNDRELLELAAKAAGISKAPEGDNFDNPTFEDERTEDFYLRDDGEFWSPLEDDGDALRLAVKFGFLPVMNFLLRAAEKLERLPADECAAWRRAIVLGAAEKGRQMP